MVSTKAMKDTAHKDTEHSLNRHLDKRYLSEKEVSRITGRAVQTLRNDRFMRRGIPYHKIGRSVRYSLDDVIAFMERHRIETEAI